MVISRGIYLYSSIAEAKTSFDRLENYIGYIVARDFTLEAPHIIKTEKQKIMGGTEGVRTALLLSGAREREVCDPVVQPHHLSSQVFCRPNGRQPRNGPAVPPKLCQSV